MIDQSKQPMNDIHHIVNQHALDSEMREKAFVARACGKSNAAPCAFFFVCFKGG
jgi:hypothetical protein